MTHPYVLFATSGESWLYVPILELEQGSLTALAVLIAEELDANRSGIGVVK